MKQMMQRIGKTQADARSNLKAALRERQGRGSARINDDTRLPVVGTAWHSAVRAGQHVATGSKRRNTLKARMPRDTPKPSSNFEELLNVVDCHTCCVAVQVFGNACRFIEK